MDSGEHGRDEILVEVAVLAHLKDLLPLWGAETRLNLLQCHIMAPDLARTKLWDRDEQEGRRGMQDGEEGGEKGNKMCGGRGLGDRLMRSGDSKYVSQSTCRSVGVTVVARKARRYVRSLTPSDFSPVTPSIPWPSRPLPLMYMDMCSIAVGGVWDNHITLIQAATYSHNSETL